MPKVRSTRVRGKRVKLHLQPVDGYFAEWKEGGEIYIDPRLSDERAMCALIHELTHAINPDMPEERVKEIERTYCGPILRLFTVKKREGAW